MPPSSSGLVGGLGKFKAALNELDPNLKGPAIIVIRLRNGVAPASGPA
jgi:hypothetical protein